MGVYSITVHMYKKRNTLTWKGGPLFMVANPHPPFLAGPLLEVNYPPLCPLPSPNAHACFSAIGHLFSYFCWAELLQNRLCIYRTQKASIVKSIL